MKVISLACLTTALVGFSAPSFAQGLPAPNRELSTYGTIGYTYVDGGAFAEFGVATARLGVKQGYFGVEAEGGVGVAGSRGSGIKTSLQYTLAGFAVVALPVSERFQLMGRLGYGSTRVKISTPSGRIATNVESVNYGGGALFSVTARDHLRAEYTRYDTEGAGGADGLSISYVRKF